jgi:D-3-phosphoglycerate dehydrogenase
MTATVLVTDYAWESLETERQILAQAGARLLVATTGTEEELIALAPQADAILTCWGPVTAAVLDAAPRCRTVARYGVGLDNIDVDRATQLGIVVTNVPDYCVEEVSDHTAALILALTRHVVPFAAQVRAGTWDATAAGPMRRLRGQTLGLVGSGAIARRVAEKMTGFGMRALAWSPSVRVGQPAGAATGVGSLAEILECSDVVSLHVPLTAATRGVIDAAALARMNPRHCWSTPPGGRSWTRRRWPRRWPRGSWPARDWTCCRGNRRVPATRCCAAATSSSPRMSRSPRPRPSPNCGPRQRTTSPPSWRARSRNTW